MSIDPPVKFLLVENGFRLTLLPFGMLGWTGFDVRDAGVAAWGQRDRGDDFGGGSRCVPNGWRGGVATGRDYHVSTEGRYGRWSYNTKS